uniref:Putative c-type lectin n=1 Tax=Lutzomyia longipalpis TaxID=7200 RepID=A0A1B0CL44_LUTLO
MKYAFSELNWIDAYKFCETYNATLASIDNEEENKEIMKVIKDTIPHELDWWPVWIGGYKYNDGTTWRWISNGEEIRYSNWVSDQPDNWNNQENCLNTRYDGQWNDLTCTQTHYFICQVNESPCKCH